MRCPARGCSLPPMPMCARPRPTAGSPLGPLGLWAVAEAELRALFRACAGVAEVSDAPSFARRLGRYRPETRWAPTTAGRRAAASRRDPVAHGGRRAGSGGRGNRACAPPPRVKLGWRWWLLLALPAAVWIGVAALLRRPWTLGARPLPAAWRPAGPAEGAPCPRAAGALQRGGCGRRARGASCLPCRISPLRCARPIFRAPRSRPPASGRSCTRRLPAPGPALAGRSCPLRRWQARLVRAFGFAGAIGAPRVPRPASGGAGHCRCRGQGAVDGPAAAGEILLGWPEEAQEVPQPAMPLDSARRHLLRVAQASRVCGGTGPLGGGDGARPDGGPSDREQRAACELLPAGMAGRRMACRSSTRPRKTCGRRSTTRIRPASPAGRRFCPAVPAPAILPAPPVRSSPASAAPPSAPCSTPWSAAGRTRRFGPARNGLRRILRRFRPRGHHEDPDGEHGIR